MSYVVKDNKGTSWYPDHGYFTSREQAKETRDNMRRSGHTCVVSRSPKHPKGESFPEFSCHRLRATTPSIRTHHDSHSSISN